MSLTEENSLFQKIHSSAQAELETSVQDDPSHNNLLVEGQCVTKMYNKIVLEFLAWTVNSKTHFYKKKKNTEQQTKFIGKFSLNDMFQNGKLQKSDI